VQGAAVGAGFGLALLADFRLCSGRAYFSANFVAHGLHHGFGLTASLPRAIGWQKANDLLMTGRKVSADEALAIGLVTQIVEESELATHAMALAQQIAKHPPQAVRAIRRTMREKMVSEFAEAVRHEVQMQNSLRVTTT
jgi:enoyl-CoA hydratase/carnithine racemase